MYKYMYDYIPFIFAGVSLIIGLYVIINPKSATKKENRENPDMVDKAKKVGYYFLAFAVFNVLSGIIRLKLNS